MEDLQTLTPFGTQTPPHRNCKHAQDLLPQHKGMRLFAPHFWTEFPNADKETIPAQRLADMAQHAYTTLGAYMQELHTNKKRLHVAVHKPKHTHNTVVEILLPDQPFIVDTVWLHLQQHKCKIIHAVHPLWNIHLDTTGRLKTVSPTGDTRSSGFQIVHMYLEVESLGSEKACRELQNLLIHALTLAHQAVADFDPMLTRMKSLLASQEAQPIRTTEDEENLAFLRWLLQNNFIFLGYRSYTLNGVKQKKGRTIQAVKNSGLGILKHKKSSLEAPTPWEDVAPNLRVYFQENSFFTVAKALEKSAIHRAAEMDYISLKMHDKEEDTITEHRFVGLFTSKAYTTAAQSIPIIGRKIRNILLHCGYPRASHNYRALQNILEMFPRDELLATHEKDLQRIATGILHLQERPQVRLFLRRNKFERQLAVMVFLPVERMNSALRYRIQDVLMAELQGESLDYALHMGEGQLAQLMFHIRTKEGTKSTVTEQELEEKIAAIAIGWLESLQNLLIQLHNVEEGIRLFQKYEEQFSLGYQEQTPVTLAAQDITTLEELDTSACNTIHFSYCPGHMYGRAENANNAHIRVFTVGDMLPLSRVMPLFEHMGLSVQSENPYRLLHAEELTSCQGVWLHDFTLAEGQELSEDAIPNVMEVLTAAWYGEIEDDKLAALCARIHINVFQLTFLRALVAYHRQAAIRVSKQDVYSILLKYPEIPQAALQWVEGTFNPHLANSTRQTQQAEAIARYTQALENIQTLDEEKVAQKFWGITQAMLRTNAWARNTPHQPIAFKFASSRIPDMPKPTPWREIFVYSKQLEGVHLRGGKVARGGLRWSDRHADFRTEILGLMKAQMTKNTVIVPVGAKGGFVIKRPLTGDRKAVMQQVESHYRTFIQSLLSITDNRMGSKIIHPQNVLCLDGEDPYFVVAADKGTATFSDVANEEAIKADFWPKTKDAKKPTGFWLGDAFASGGSEGYDHKAMGITARGAWESVKHHFAGMDVDIQKEDFTVIGIGDMSGDVFGNGMLLSQHIQLVGAFNHLHIFVDPEPDAATSFKERQRLFNTPLSTWMDYDTKALSKGGKVFERSAKSLTLTAPIQKRFGLTKKNVTPNELIRAMLGAEVDLLWNGGIGTYLKASTETHADASDRANDPIRLNGKDIRAKVVGEGGNLGCTQLGRIEYALGGGRINTDALDNAAGVNTSDHEVNIKILLEQFPATKKLSAPKRSAVLKEMTENVAELVLTGNAAQAQAITLKAQQKANNTESCWRLQHVLGNRGMLDAGVEFLPNQEDLEDRHRKGEGYTRPELCVLMAYAKMDIYDALLESTVPDEPSLQPLLKGYFPTQLQGYGAAMHSHPLARHIIATRITNQLVNRMGMTFLNRLREETGHSTADVTRAYLLSYQLFDAVGWWKLIRAQVNHIPSHVQYKMLATLKNTLEFGTYWMLQNHTHPLNISKTYEDMHPVFESLLTSLMAQELPEAKGWETLGVKPEPAQAMAVLENMVILPDTAHVSRKNSKFTPADVLERYQHLGRLLRLPELYAHAGNIPVSTTWQRVAVRTLVHELYTQHARILKSFLKQGGDVANWQTKCQSRLTLYQQHMTDILEGTPTESMVVAMLGQLKGL